jgi:hypothetical protein
LLSSVSIIVRLLIFEVSMLPDCFIFLAFLFRICASKSKLLVESLIYLQSFS